MSAMTRKAFYAAIEDILGVPHGSLRDCDTRDTIGTWSSVADVQILTAISSQFGIEPDPQLLEAETVGDLLAALEARNAFSV